jgi:two-component system sensor histidine kinase CpxA
MRARFPLWAKILACFFANLSLIALAAYAFIEFEFHIGPESLLAGRAGRRVDALADLVAGELAGRPPSAWSGVLARAGNLYGLQLLLVTAEGRHVAGGETPLPPAVVARLFRPGPPLPPGAMRPPRPEEEGLPPPPEPGQEMPPGEDGYRPELRDSPLPPPPEHLRDHRMAHTRDPSRYWLLIPIDMQRLGREYSPAHAGRGLFPPLTLVAVSDSIGLGGLVLDLTPWLAAAGGVLLLSALFWLPLVRGITRSIGEMTGATARIAEGRFDIRVGENRGDELGLLARSVNGMAGRLAGFVNGQKRFLGDIAHELCSPLARIQVALGILESHVDAGMLGDLREEAQQMSGLVNELLSFSKASLGAGRITLQSVPLRDALARAMERESLPGLEVRADIPDGLSVKAEPDLLCRALSNILRNAAKYAGDAGLVEAGAERAGDNVILTVSDHGPGVPADALPQIFDPFYRVDVSRARETGGAGLGLAIVKTCIDSCGGAVTCRNRDPHGLSVIITLPIG